MSGFRQVSSTAFALLGGFASGAEAEAEAEAEAGGHDFEVKASKGESLIVVVNRACAIDDFVLSHPDAETVEASLMNAVVRAVLTKVTKVQFPFRSFGKFEQSYVAQEAPNVATHLMDLAISSMSVCAVAGAAAASPVAGAAAASPTPDMCTLTWGALRSKLAELVEISESD